jgi:NADH dehydrogenase/NADH:ubiquinone oxidoreductase subunit G
MFAKIKIVVSCQHMLVIFNRIKKRQMSCTLGASEEEIVKSLGGGL